jgi:hypothetical protein
VEPLKLVLTDKQRWDDKEKEIEEEETEKHFFIQ